ncbi:hypothetical protein QAD02_011951 [Eretmocerus hayati]|uniref:Uncharacterized protein n=1 Tax=Eretmocerus hayati TaxID=131215 RepID=A0ACC2NXY7_9HYME|nr:hypothetical protein QAD02_011951 [Eretmocerus hayati]
MRKRISMALMGLLVMCFMIISSESKLQQQATVEAATNGEANDDDDDDDDDVDDNSREENYPSETEIDDEGRVYKNPRNFPSPDCPRDESQAEILGQKCLRKCSTDEDCKSKKKKCRCDGACGMTCIKPERECPEISEIEHGVMSVSGRLFADKANYTCDPGYHLVGLAQRTCRADGRWTGDTPSCKKDPTSFCSVPNKLPNARHNAYPEQTTFDLDSLVQYFCDHGYETKGSPKAKCLMIEGTASWFGPDITCEPTNCGPPTDVANGWHAGECYKYDCHVSYHCADGYELVGKAEKICIADGTWLPAELPKCVEVTSVECTPPDNPLNGKAIFTSVAYNSVVSYECRSGYTIVGASTRRCNADGKWSGHQPSCREIDCGSPGVLHNGWIDNIENGTGMGASLIFRCKEHMKLEGHSSSVCQMDGKWRYSLPQCLAPCIVPQIARGHVYVHSDEQDHINNVTIAEHGKHLEVECIQDYEFAQSHHPVICNNGTWTIVPSCTPARCKQMPKPPKNGMVIAPKTDHGMKAVFKCKDGFELIGGGPYNNSVSVECQYGNWTGDIPHCIEVYCPFPGYVENGKVLLVGNMGVYDYRPYVKKVVNNKQIMYDCDKGYYLSEGPPGATCIGGSWSPKELPKCTLGQHPRIRWNRRRRSIDEPRNETVVMAYRKFIDFFRKIGKKLLELEMEKSQEALSHTDESENSGSNLTLSISNDTSSSNLVHNLTKISLGHNGKMTHSQDEKMIDFLRTVYRKLQRIDSRHASNDSDVTMHDLLNAMSKNFFHVDLSISRKNSTGKNHESAESKSQREFTKLKREFERIMRFYNKSLRWSEKHMRKDLRKKKKNQGHEKDKPKAKGRDKKKEEDKEKKKHKSPNYYKGFYEFLNDYVTQRLTALEAQNATEELIKKMKIDKISIRNGTMFTVGEIYTFFKHIIEAKLNASKAENETVSSNLTSPSTAITQSPVSRTEKIPHTTISVSSTSKASLKTTTRSSKRVVVSENEIPALEPEVEQPKLRNKRIRDTSTRSPITEVRRKLLSINHPLGSETQSMLKFAGEDGVPVAQFTLKESEEQQRSRIKRFLQDPEMNNQMFLKNLYLNAYEEEYRQNVENSVDLKKNDGANWYLKGRHPQPMKREIQ